MERFTAFLCGSSCLGGAVLQLETDYKYDVWGNRLEKDVTQSGTTTVQRFAYDGWNPAKAGATGNARFDVWADLDGSNHLVTRYILGDQINQRFARESAAGTVAWYLAGPPRLRARPHDATGAAQDHIDYNAWGKNTAESNSYDRLISEADLVVIAAPKSSAASYEVFVDKNWKERFLGVLTDARNTFSSLATRCGPLRRPRLESLFSPFRQAARLPRS